MRPSATRQTTHAARPRAPGTAGGRRQGKHAGGGAGQAGRAGAGCTTSSMSARPCSRKSFISSAPGGRPRWNQRCTLICSMFMRAPGSATSSRVSMSRQSALTSTSCRAARARPIAPGAPDRRELTLALPPRAWRALSRTVHPFGLCRTGIPQAFPATTHTPNNRLGGSVGEHGARPGLRQPLSAAVLANPEQQEQFRAWAGQERTGSRVYSAATIFRAKRGSLASKGYRPYNMAYRMTPQLQMSAHCAAGLGA